MGMQGRHHVLTVFCLNLRRGAYGRPVLINVFFFLFLFLGCIEAMTWYGMSWVYCLLIYKYMMVSTRYMYSDNVRNDTFTFYY